VVENTGYLYGRPEDPTHPDNDPINPGDRGPSIDEDDEDFISQEELLEKLGLTVFDLQ